MEIKLTFLCANKTNISGATAEYAQNINDVFDVMNSTKSEGSKGFKRPISRDTYQEYSELFDKVIEYIKGLKVACESGPILSSVSHTPFTGFLNNMINFMSLFKDYVLTNKIESGMLITHRFCQDLIETLFGCIRSMGGFNNNPTVQQFEAAFRKLLVHNDIVSPKKSNCIEFGSKILSVSSQRNANQPQNQQATTDDDLIVDEFEFDFINQYTDDAHSHSLAFKASMLESKILKAKKTKELVKCETCINAFVENELIEDSFIRFKYKTSDYMQPCKSTFEICKYVDTFLKFFEGTSISFNATIMHILRKIPFETLYPCSDFDAHEKGHKYEFVKQIISVYMHMKSIQTARAITLKAQENPIRHKLTKMIQREGQ